MTVAEFQEKLKEFDLTVVTSPLSESDVIFIESILCRKLPDYYREFLLTIGLKQDAIWGLNAKISAFDPLVDFLPNGQSKDFFQFGHNGGEDYWLLRNDDWTDRTIYEFDYYADFEIKSLGKTFDDLLDEAIQQLAANKNSLIANSKKVWAVQFSIATDNISVIIDSLKKEFDCSLLKDVENVQVSSAGVINSKGKIKLQGSEIPIKKQEYKDWETASFSFDWKESVYDMNNRTLVKKIENRLKKDGLKVVLIDYGILNLE